MVLSYYDIHAIAVHLFGCCFFFFFLLPAALGQDLIQIFWLSKKAYALEYPGTF